jgi:hypothetical protein
MGDLIDLEVIACPSCGSEVEFDPDEQDTVECMACGAILSIEKNGAGVYDSVMLN